ncbi:MAG: hypothetical protein RL077_1665 [Verrucomicrobiota bacterium]
MIDETGFRAVLDELTEENTLACRGLLSISRVEFTNTVQTAAVSLEARPVLRVNLEFVRAHCERESHVKALLIHEFLHILLRHTLEIRQMTPTINIALDAVINAIIHRKLGSDYSGFMSRYYAAAEGPLVLLRKSDPTDDAHYSFSRGEPRKAGFQPNRAKLETMNWLGVEGHKLWTAIYAGKALHEDVLEFLKAKRIEQWQNMLANGTPLFLGNHAGDGEFDSDDIPEEFASRLRASAKELAGQGVLPDHAAQKPGDLSVPPTQSAAAAAWERLTLQLLRRLVVPDPRGGTRELQPAWSHLPILNEGDRRGLLLSLWNPLVSEITWPTFHSQPRGSVSVYLDVSGSLSGELKALVALFNRFERHLRRPFWAFADTVEPAHFSRGRLVTRSTGGTSVACVLDHLRRTRPAKALIITDGFVEKLKSNDYAVPGTTVEVLLTSKGTEDVLCHSRRPLHRLPPAPGARIQMENHRLPDRAA